jgi:VWFA-related protein
MKRFFIFISIMAALTLFVVAATPFPQSGSQSAQTPAQNPSGAQGQAAPQNPSQAAEVPGYKLTVRSNLVLVPVIVTDKHGEHVTGLKAEDFEVKEDDKPQNIIRVDELTTGDTSKVERPAVAANNFSNEVVAEHPKKLEIIALDQINVPFAGGADGNRMLIDFLSRNLDTNTLLALVAMTPNGVRIIHDFTAQPAVLSAALGKIRNMPKGTDLAALDFTGENTSADIEVLQLEALLNGSSIDFSNVNPQNAAAVARAMSQSARATIDASRRAQQGLITLECFQQIAEYFGGVPGRKSLIWASTAFPFGLGTAVNNSTTRGTIMEDWDRTFQALTDANIAVYAVDIGGLVTGATANNLQSLNTAVIKTQGAEGGVGARSQGLAALNAGEFNDPNVGRQETMRQLADRTGGQAFYNSNDGADLFRRAGADAGQYYTIAYYTKDTGKYGWRKLNVKVKRDGVKVRARSGYFFNDPKKANDPNASVKDLKMALTSDLSFTSVPLRGEWLQTEPAGADRKVHFVLSIPPGVPGIDAEHQNHISLDFLVVATDTAGKNVTISQRLDTNLKPDGVEQIQTKGIDYTNVLNLVPGDYKVHFVVRDNLRGIMGSVVSPLKVN